MKKAQFFILYIIYTLILTFFCLSSRAQKVNNVQSESIQAPSTLKIDGKLNEWGPNLQAYNKTTKVWYTIANDDKNIYLAVRSTDANNINKILAGGISFTINTSDKKKDKGAYVITFPVIATTGGRGQGRSRRGFGSQQDAPDSAAIIQQHKQTLATCKQISAIGFPAITDTLISIYNEYGIKAAANIDDKGNFIYELAIPFKMLALTDQKEIAYNIKLNGLQVAAIGGFGGKNGGDGGGGRNGGGGFGGGGGLSGFGGRDNSDPDDMTSPTDFWGKYTLYTNNASK